jgi:hypothetical protein
MVAEGVAIDQLTSRVTAFNMLDHFLVPGLPARILRMAVLAVYEVGAQAETFAERITLAGPDGGVIASSETTVSLPERVVGQMPNGHRSIHMLWSTPLAVAGDYRLVLSHRTEKEGAWNDVSGMVLTALVQPHPILNPQSVTVSSSMAAAPPAEGSQPPKA